RRPGSSRRPRSAPSCRPTRELAGLGLAGLGVVGLGPAGLGLAGLGPGRPGVLRALVLARLLADAAVVVGGARRAVGPIVVVIDAPDVGIGRQVVAVVWVDHHAGARAEAEAEAETRADDQSDSNTAHLKTSGR